MTFQFDHRDRESVLHDLASPDEEVRRLAVERVEALPVGDAISKLVERIGDPSWRVRKAAVERLVACSDISQAVAALIVALGDGENTGRRNAAVEALVDLGAGAVPQLIEAENSDDPDLRKLVVDALAGIGDESSVPTLVASLDDPDPNVRAAVTEALGAIGGDESAAALQRTAVNEGEDRLVRFSALHAMAALELPLRAADVAPVLSDPVLRPAGLALLGRVPDGEAIAELRKALGSHARSVREAAIGSLLRALSRVDGEELEQLRDSVREAALATPLVIGSAVDRLDEPSLATRLMLVQFLGIVAAEETVVPLLLAAQDEALTQVVLANLEAMGELAEVAIDAAWPDLDLAARRDACLFFGRMAGEASAARMMASLDDPNPELRNAAASAIGHRGLVAALPALLHRLEHAAQEDDFESEEELALLTDAMIDLVEPDREAGSENAAAIDLLIGSIEGAVAPVRLAIATVIGRIGRQRDSQVIELLLKDPSPLVRRAAVDALAHLDHGTAAESLRLALADEASMVRIAAAGALGASRNHEVIDVLRCLTDDQDPNVRAAAVKAVGNRCNPERDTEEADAGLALIDAALEDEAVVALAAVDALRGFGACGAERLLGVVARSEPELVQEAVRCIGETGEGATLDALLPLVSHADWTVRAETIQALSQRGLEKAVPAILRRLETEQDDFVRDTILRALDRLGS